MFFYCLFSPICLFKYQHEADMCPVSFAVRSNCLQDFDLQIKFDHSKNCHDSFIVWEIREQQHWLHSIYIWVQVHLNLWWTYVKVLSLY